MFNKDSGKLKSGNVFDPFTIKVCERNTEPVGHLCLEITRVTKFIIGRGATADVEIFSDHYKRSPIGLRSRVKGLGST